MFVVLLGGPPASFVVGTVTLHTRRPVVGGGGGGGGFGATVRQLPLVAASCMVFGALARPRWGRRRNRSGEASLLHICASVHGSLLEVSFIDCMVDTIFYPHAWMDPLRGVRAGATLFGMASSGTWTSLWSSTGGGGIKWCLTGCLLCIYPPVRLHDVANDEGGAWAWTR